MQGNTLAVDFGTSNSAAAYLSDDRIFRVKLDGEADTIPTAVFFPEDGSDMSFGSQATQALIDGEEGRYMRALKSVLGLSLLHEKRLICGKRRTLSDMITAFLSRVKTSAEASAGKPFSRVLSGRPVRFHSADAGKDAQAEIDLRACYEAAGFDEVSFLPEPEAAAFCCQNMGDGSGLGLIVDIGGGTSDFSVFETSEGMPSVIASHGIRLGGTNFDQAVSLAHAMPLLGLGGQLRREMGAGLLPVPRAPFVDLSSWPKIPFLYTAEMRRKVDAMVRLSEAPDVLSRLSMVLEAELGHAIAFEVESAKIAANGSPEGGQLRLGMLGQGIDTDITPDDLNQALLQYRVGLSEAFDDVLCAAGISGEAIKRVILVGGSSLMRIVADEAVSACPRAELIQSDAFTAVVDGLALASKNG